jgi:hypothetical protein
MRQWGPKTPKSSMLMPAEEAIVVAFRQKTLLPLDDVLGCLKDTIPNLSRSALYRSLQRHGISRLPVEATHFAHLSPHCNSHHHIETKYDYETGGDSLGHRATNISAKNGTEMGPNPLNAWTSRATWMRTMRTSPSGEK